MKLFGNWLAAVSVSVLAIRFAECSSDEPWSGDGP